MGTKGSKLTGAAPTSAERLQADLFGLGDISIRKMFGGYGVFESGTMFALVDSQGALSLRIPCQI